MPSTISRPPGPRSRALLGEALALRRDVLGLLTEISTRYGDIVQFRVARLNVLLLRHPDHVRTVLQANSRNFVKGRPLYLAKRLLGDGLLTTEGSIHGTQSRTVQPALYAEKLRAYSVIIAECAEQRSSAWRNGETRDLMREMTSLATVISGRTLLQWPIDRAAAEQIVTALEDATSLFSRAPIPLSEWLLKLPLPSSRRFHRAKAHLDDAMYARIADRRAQPAETQDVLSLLLAAQNEGVADQSIRDQALTMFLTALDTTSLALTWTWYILSQHPQEEAALHAELDEVLGDRAPTIADIERLRYTRMVFLEAMRLFPPIYAIAREAVSDFSIGGYDIPGRTLVLLSPYITQRDARFFAEPERFTPGRWADDAPRPPGFAYFPFGGGPRGCIGQSYAMLEGVLVLAALARRWRFRLVPGHPVALRPLINLRPRYGMNMTLEERRPVSEVNENR